jgi:hypothetical protein
MSKKEKEFVWYVEAEVNNLESIYMSLFKNEISEADFQSAIILSVSNMFKMMFIDNYVRPDVFSLYKDESSTDPQQLLFKSGTNSDNPSNEQQFIPHSQTESKNYRDPSEVNLLGKIIISPNEYRILSKRNTIPM